MNTGNEIVESFKKIYFNNQRNKIIPFLKELKNKDKKALLPFLRECASKSTYKENREIFYVTTLVCATESQFIKLTEWFYNNTLELVDEVLEWYCPAWFSKVYNKKAKNSWNPLSYTDLLRWTLKGYIEPDELLIARSLGRAPFYFDEKSRKRCSTDAFLELDPLVFDEHIWTLFKYEVSMFDYSEYSPKDADIQDAWTRIFLKYTASGRISRMRVLKGILLTITYDFKSGPTGWFANLFIAMKPTTEELLELQDELFATFSSKYSKLVNTALNSVKQIAGSEKFQIDGFISHLPVLLMSEVKSILLSTLTIAEKVAKNHPEKQGQICCELAYLFLNKDEAIQQKTAKIIKQYGVPYSDLIKESLVPYQDAILSSVKELLIDFIELVHVETIDNCGITEPLKAIDENQRVPAFNTVEDIVFFLSKFFGSDVPVYIDLLPAVIMKLNSLIKPENLSQLEIPLIKAYELSYHRSISRYDFKDGTTSINFWGRGLYYHLSAIFFINYCQYLCRRFPTDAAYIAKMHEEAVDLDIKESKRERFNKYNRQILPLNEWHGQQYPVFRPYHRIMCHALNLIEREIDLPLLSTPTHLPAWIQQDMLDKRINQYKVAGVEPDSIDLQMALSRCPGFVPEEVLQHLKKYSWKISDEKEKDGNYNEHYFIQMDIPLSPWEDQNNLYACIGDNISYSIGPSDISNFILTYPTALSIPYALLVRSRIKFSQVANAETRDVLLPAIQMLYNQKTAVDSYTALFLACSILCSDRNIRNYAAEIWLERSLHNLIDNVEFGSMIGKLFNADWAPVKRLTDLITSFMMNITHQQNTELQVLMEAILSQLHRTVTNLKKLLEIYSELLVLNNSTANLQLTQMHKWQDEKSLKKIIERIINKK
ncbi:DUF6493 family protein [Bacteroides sp. 519]|uniref:DUF6493 family protein n=1 Tax=Bacteroides sp. 519 TaxID=2302937 RepID=UPI0013D60A29|nr:DUF6493 family protein [Bacteroides sp. 519]